VGRVNDLAPLTLRKVEIAGQRLFLVKDDKGGIRCFHNTCRHRGSELCAAAREDAEFPTHHLSLSSMELRPRRPAGARAFVPLTPDFRKEDFGLYSVQVRVWNGFIFVCLADDAAGFRRGARPRREMPSTTGRWTRLVTGHTHDQHCSTATGRSSGKTTMNACTAPAFIPASATWCRSTAKGYMAERGRNGGLVRRMPTPPLKPAPAHGR
jgi:phenylpropionate dioxygenase-like ring-hydroxylating dioxygenase large terminal subunit